MHSNPKESNAKQNIYCCLFIVQQQPYCVTNFQVFQFCINTYWASFKNCKYFKKNQKKCYKEHSKGFQDLFKTQKIIVRINIISCLFVNSSKFLFLFVIWHKSSTVQSRSLMAFRFLEIDGTASFHYIIFH